MAGDPDDAVELAHLHAEFDRLWSDLERWQLRWGPIRVRARLGSQRLAAVFAAFHGLTVTAGVVFIFVGESYADLGIALVVGSLFGFGAFLAQVWAMQSERESVLFLDEHRARFNDLQRQWEQLTSRRQDDQ